MSTKSSGVRPTSKTPIGKLGAKLSSAAGRVEASSIDGVVSRRKVRDNGIVNFELGNDECRLFCVVFSRIAVRLSEFSDGDRVEVEVGKVDLYPPFGRESVPSSTISCCSTRRCRSRVALRATTLSTFRCRRLRFSLRRTLRQTLLSSPGIPPPR